MEQTKFANFRTIHDRNSISLTIELEEQNRTTFNRALNSARSLSSPASSSCLFLRSCPFSRSYEWIREHKASVRLTSAYFGRAPFAFRWGRKLFLAAGQRSFLRA